MFVVMCVLHAWMAVCGVYGVYASAVCVVFACVLYTQGVCLIYVCDMCRLCVCVGECGMHSVWGGVYVV